jgi:hypothetical protein
LHISVNNKPIEFNEECKINACTQHENPYTFFYPTDILSLSRLNSIDQKGKKFSNIGGGGVVLTAIKTAVRPMKLIEPYINTL